MKDYSWFIADDHPIVTVMPSDAFWMMLRVDIEANYPNPVGTLQAMRVETHTLSPWRTYGTLIRFHPDA